MQDRLEHPWIAADALGRSSDPERQSLVGGEKPELIFNVVQDRLDRKRLDPGCDNTGLKPRNLEQRVQRRRKFIHGPLRAAEEPVPIRGGDVSSQHVQRQADDMKRLLEIVSDSGKNAAL